MNTEDSAPKSLRIGTRGSALARWQAEWVADELRSHGYDVELVIIKTGGDGSDVPLNSIGGIGLFTREIQNALLQNRVDLAVHSLKDLPTDPIEGLVLSSVPTRASVFDVLVANDFSTLERLPNNAKIGTGSVRRKSQILFLNPKLVVQDIRGNVDTRLRKLDDRQYDAIILAEAGLTRLGWQDRITQRIPLEQMLPAVGQGALGIETRSGDTATIAAVQNLDDQQAHAAVVAERTLLSELQTGCLAPVGAHATVTPSGLLSLRARVLDGAGTTRIESSARGPLENARELGKQIALELQQRGAAKLIAESRNA